jgi:hypothetical protein
MLLILALFAVRIWQFDAFDGLADVEVVLDFIQMVVSFCKVNKRLIEFLHNYKQHSILIKNGLICKMRYNALVWAHGILFRSWPL